MNRSQPSSLLLEQHPAIVLRGREGLRIQTRMPAVLGDRPLAPASLACVGFPARDFSLHRRKGPGREGGRAVQPQLPCREQGSRLWEGCWGLQGGEEEGHMCQAKARRSPALAAPFSVQA